MYTNDILSEIRDANLSYLMLAQQMLRADRPAAIYRLGLSEPIADLMNKLSTAQVLKLAGSVNLLTRFRFDDAEILGLLTHERKSPESTQTHAAILLAGQTAEAVH